jgi:hypothetical protein
VSIDAISITQRGNLQNLEKTLRKQWRLGQNIVLCWCWDERGLLVILVPHYFLGNYCAGKEASPELQSNEAFVQELVSGVRRKSRDQLFGVAERLGVSPTFIKLAQPLEESFVVLDCVEEIIRRYGLSFVNRRGVVLFDITNFSLFSSFEQASQLNSLSYSMNSAYNKLAGIGVEVNFARTTTGDGYYVWNRDMHPRADQDLFVFFLLVVADNALARAASRGNTVPVIRAAYHIGSHYELYQAEGVNPTVFSYIVGDVTIELSRILDSARPGQLLLGDFAKLAADPQGCDRFLRSCLDTVSYLQGMSLMGEPIERLDCCVSRSPTGEGAGEGAAASRPLDVAVVDKHGLNHHAFNLEARVQWPKRDISLGLTPAELAAPASTA